MLLLAAAQQTKFRGMFWVMLLYAIVYAGTLPLVNKILFDQVHSDAAHGWVFFWGCVGWALACYFLTGLRQLRKASGDGPTASIWRPRCRR